MLVKATAFTFYYSVELNIPIWKVSHVWSKPLPISESLISCEILPNSFPIVFPYSNVLELWGAVLSWIWRRLQCTTRSSWAWLVSMSRNKWSMCAPLFSTSSCTYWVLICIKFIVFALILLLVFWSPVHALFHCRCRKAIALQRERKRLYMGYNGKTDNEVSFKASQLKWTSIPRKVYYHRTGL